MSPRLRTLLPALAGACLLALALPGSSAAAAGAAAGTAADAAAIERGEYVFRAAGGCGCHTDRPGGGAPLAGGRALETPFGTFYSTNITPDRRTGIGAWSDAEFIRAMRHGVGPDGTHYFPVFPYTSFTRMSEADLRDLKAYLFSREPVRRANRPHDLWPVVGWRVLLPVWKWLHFEPARFAPDAQRSAAENRGAYLARGPGHCGECHTPRTLLGAPRQALFLAGSRDGPEGELAPNITPDEATGIGSWLPADVTWFLRMGLKPDGDDAQGLMAELIEHGYSHLSPEDLDALAAYLLALPPVRHEVKSDGAAGG